MVLETIALAGVGAAALGLFARPNPGRFAIWGTRPRIATREPPKQVQSYAFCAGPTSCERSRRMHGHQFTIEGGRKLLPARCGQVDCGCHYRRIDEATAPVESLRAQRSACRQTSFPGAGQNR